MLTVVHDQDSSNEDAGASRSLLDEIVRDGARQMLAAALAAEVAETICSLRSVNSRKADLVGASLAFQMLALVLLSVSVGCELSLGPVLTRS